MDGGVATQASPQRFFHMPRIPQYQKQNFYRHPTAQPGIAFDGKRMRKAVHRRTIDYNASCIKTLQNRIWQRDYRDMRAIQPDNSYLTDLPLPFAMGYNPINAVTTKFVRTSTNKVRCPIFVVRWTPEGRRLVTGASSGEFTLWNGLTFNFETILQAHEYPVRTMTWSHNDMWMCTGDHAGYIKYWQSNMNNVKMFQAHKEPIREASFCPTDNKFATCSDDGTVRIWDFMRCHEERILRGHGADVRCVDWHPQKSLLVSGSKDSQQPVKLWDPKSGHSLATLHAHKSTVMEAKWNQNGNWLLTASRDHLIKLFDIRMMKEMFTFRGHKKEATAIAWHPIHENLFTSGGSDGGILFWQVGNDKEVGGMEQAHEGMVWSLAWHPLGHILCSGSNDHTTKFWTRNRPGDKMRDKYNLNILPAGTSEDALEYDDESVNAPLIPGMGLEHGLPEHLSKSGDDDMGREMEAAIPGLDSEGHHHQPSHFQHHQQHHHHHQQQQIMQKKVPYAKPIPAQFKKQWERQKDAPLLEREKENEREKEQEGSVMNPDGQNAPPPLMSAPIIPTFEQGKQIAMQMLLSGASLPPPNVGNQPPPPPPPPPQPQNQQVQAQVQAHSAAYASVQAQIQENIATMGQGPPLSMMGAGPPGPPGMGQQMIRGRNLGPGLLGEPPGGFPQGMRPPMPGMLIHDNIHESSPPPPPPPPPPKDGQDRRDPRQYAKDRDMRQPPMSDRNDPRRHHHNQRPQRNEFNQEPEFGIQDVDLRQNMGYENRPPQDEDLRENRFEPREQWGGHGRDMDERRPFPSKQFYGEQSDNFGQNFPQDLDERGDFPGGFQGGRLQHGPGRELPEQDSQGRGYQNRPPGRGRMPPSRDQDDRHPPHHDYFNDFDERSRQQPDMRSSDLNKKPPSLLDLPPLPPPPPQKRPWEEGPGDEHGNRGDRSHSRDDMSPRGGKHGRFDDEEEQQFSNPAARQFPPPGRDPRARGLGRGGGMREGGSDRGRGRGGIRGGRGQRGGGPPSRGPGRGRGIRGGR
ncbi:uncharacterized protein LOC144451462 [Glandiceps talaboti]